MRGRSGDDAVRSYVLDEDRMYYSHQQDTHSLSQPSGPPTITVEAPSTDAADPAEEVVHENVEPTPTVEQRRFSAPQYEWDATRAPPPASSHPEAANFPTQSYEFTADPTPFQPPQSYPEPPKDMWYEVPKIRPMPHEARPNPIFPWEQRERTRPTRVFVEDLMNRPIETSSEEDLIHGRAATNDRDEAMTPMTPTIKINDEYPPTMDPVPRNAWDDVAGIDRYVRQLSQFQKLRGKLQVLSHEPHQSQSPNIEIENPMNAAPNETESETTAPASRDRRESLILTDFPTASERPSLPVTPAPIRRKILWGEERNSERQLPGADGVPDQADWNPQERLEHLRLTSLSLSPSQLVLPAKNVPRRDMVRSSFDLGQLSPGGPGSGHISPVQARSPGADGHVHFRDEALVETLEEHHEDRPRFDSVKFAPQDAQNKRAAGNGDEVLSPTDRVVQ